MWHYADFLSALQTAGIFLTADFPETHFPEAHFLGREKYYRELAHLQSWVSRPRGYRLPIAEKTAKNSRFLLAKRT